MTKFKGADYIASATPDELKIIKRYRALDVQREGGISRRFYNRFVEGKTVPQFIRDAFKKFLMGRVKEIQKKWGK